jgi:hypothetical protein
MADTLPGAYSVGVPAQRTVAGAERHAQARRTGSRRDRSEAALRQRVEELEAFADTMAAALTELRRHTQFHTQPVTGCGVCHPRPEEHAAAVAISGEELA